jgi:hypothetical protein
LPTRRVRSRNAPGDTHSEATTVGELGVGFGASPAGNRKTKRMARKTVYVSDLSGDTIEDGKGAKIPITFEDGRRPSYELDVTAEEAAELGRKGR